MSRKKILFTGLIAIAVVFFAVRTMSTINPNDGLSFKDYYVTGTPEQQEQQTQRLQQTAPSEYFLSEIQKIQTPVTVLCVSSLGCPDCRIVTPFLLALERNPNVTVKFFKLTRRTKNLLLLRTRQAYIPTVFLSTSAGKFYDGSFVERPRSVQERVKNAKTEDEKKAVVREFRNGTYNEEIEKELLELLKKTF